MSLFGIFTMNCRQATLLCEKRRDQHLGFGERTGVWVHMLRCSLCRIFIRQSETISDEALRMSKLEAETQSTVLAPEAKNRIAQLVNDKMQGHA